ncbi:MAG: hypothetical protein E6K76_08615 [Candidatus Eisenbacteria bacterium]|uniref:DUF4177 domain-containing protein n=1 Tax=Eiseniibacteriota bacterium TaxID=2212470 RepID=A0A538T3B7_UNCEI|nr:MAG: hypothetical protein E6K76_08615 [Candidatus Eisenbacteria bacterium]
MNTIVKIPERPPDPPRGVPVYPPVVYVEPTWEYKCLARALPDKEEPDEAELDPLGADGWELVGVTTAGATQRFYFKRLRR